MSDMPEKGQSDRDGADASRRELPPAPGDGPERAGWFSDRSAIKTGVIASVIATLLFVIFIQPILGYAWGIVCYLSNNLYVGLADSYYRNAALGHRNWVEFLMLCMVISSYTGVCAGVFLGWLRLRRVLAGKGRLIELRPRYRVAMTLATVAIMFVFLVPSLNMLLMAGMDLQLNTSFQQRLTVLAPQISDKEEKQLKAMWARMKCRADYEAVNEALSQMAQRENVELPEPLVK